MTDRIESIDIFRGVAVLQMIFWQIFDFFATTDIYTQTPYYLPFFNMPINGIGVGLFAFISGASVYISIKKRLNKKAKNIEIICHVMKRYGGYILLSLFFTTFVFGFKTFYTWNEAIQGIGLAVLVAALIILFFRSKWVFILLSLIIILIQPFLRHSLSNNFFNQYFPLNPLFFNPISNMVSIFLNFTLRGFFSLSNLLPITLCGVFLSFLIINLKRRRLNRILSIIGGVIISFSLLLHFFIDRIDYYNRSPSYILLYIGLSFALFALIQVWLKKIQKNWISNSLILLGKSAIVAYLLHYILIYKSLELLKIESSFSPTISYIFTICSILLIYYLCNFWLENKQKLFDKANLLLSRK